MPSNNSNNNNNNNNNKNGGNKMPLQDKLREMDEQRRMIELKKREIEMQLSINTNKNNNQKQQHKNLDKNQVNDYHQLNSSNCGNTLNQQKPPFIGKILGGNRFNFGKGNFGENNSNEDADDNNGFDNNEFDMHKKIHINACSKATSLLINSNNNNNSSTTTTTTTTTATTSTNTTVDNGSDEKNACFDYNYSLHTQQSNHSNSQQLTPQNSNYMIPQPPQQQQQQQQPFVVPNYGASMQYPYNGYMNQYQMSQHMPINYHQMQPPLPPQFNMPLPPNQPPYPPQFYVHPTTLQQQQHQLPTQSPNPYVNTNTNTIQKGNVPSTLVPLMSINTPATQNAPTTQTKQSLDNKNLEAEYESFMLLTGQKSTKDESELYNPEDQDADDESTIESKPTIIEATIKTEKLSSIDDLLTFAAKQQIEEAAQKVIENGLAYESELKKDVTNYWWFQLSNSDEYLYYKKCLDKELNLKIEKSFDKINNQEKIIKQEPLDDCGKNNNRKRKSRWSSGQDNDNSSAKVAFKDNDDEEVSERAGFGFSSSSSSSSSGSKSSNKTPTAANNNLKIESKEVGGDFMKQMKDATDRAKKIAEQLSSQMQLYPEGYVNDSKLTEEQQKQYMQQKELQGIYETMMQKRNEIENIAKKMKFKYDYDSDEEIDPEHGTWEHILRKAEMEATKEWAIKLTEMAREGNKHHIGDFIPPEELQKFFETYQALKEGRTPDLSDYKEFKLNAENVGYKLLQKLGWQEGQGLGKTNQGVTAPVNKGSKSVEYAGLGNEKPDKLNKNDDEFEMYRKRMMLAYKFRPNPLNNPRRPY